MTANKIKSTRDAFLDAQMHTHHHDGIFEVLKSRYCSGNDEDKAALCEEFTHCMKYAMIEARPEPTVERVIKFAAKFTAKSSAEEETLSFFHHVITFLLTSYEANDRTVRYRSCQLLALTIEYLGDSELDDELCDKILEAMHTRLSDKVPSVRVQAIKALSRLQDPTDKHCPIIKAFLFLMSSDPNWQVRIECLRTIAPTKRTLHGILERTRDINEMIRRTAFSVIADKISVKAFSISQRLELLESGLQDRAPMVKKVCTSKLLQTWLSHYQANILDLLSGLDIMSSGDVCENVVRELLTQAPLDEIISGFDLLDDNKLIEKERLSCESVFYYRVLLAHVSKIAEPSSDNYDALLPDAKAFIDYIKKLSDSLILADATESELENNATQEYILQQLVLCIGYLDLSDPVSRKSVVSLCKSLLSSDFISLTLVPELMKGLQAVLTDWNSRMAEVAAIISDIQMPIVMEEEQPVDPEQLHKLKYKLAGVNLNLNELSELLNEAVDKQNFAAAAEIKDKMALLEVSKTALQEEMKPKPVAQQSQPRNDNTTKLKCLTIFVESMKSSTMTTLSPTVRSYMEELVIPAIPDACPAIRNQAIQALGLCTLCDQSEAKKFIPIFLQICQLDSEAVRVSAIQALFDIILVHGVTFLQDEQSREQRNTTQHDAEDNDEDKENTESSQSEEDNSLHSPTSIDATKNLVSLNGLMSMFAGYLDDESCEVRTVCAEGLAKLLLHSRIVSRKLLSRLIILWYNPVTEDDTKLRHCLGVFFPVYAFMSRANQQQVEEAFLPTLQVLFDAPKTSPLSEIDEWNVAVLLVQLTDPQNVSNPQTGATDSLTPSSHDSLALKICNEMIEKGSGYYGLPTLAKALTTLRLSTDNESLAKDLKSMASQLTEVVNDRLVVKYIEKFKAQVDSIKAANLSANAADGTAAEDNTAEDKDSGDENTITSTALDSTLATSKYKRAARQRSTTVLSEQLDNKTSHDTSSDSDRPAHKSRRIVVPDLEADDDC